MWFGLIHDICRVSDFDDKGHGLRAAHYVKMIRNTWLGDLNENEIWLLSEAVKYHNKIRQYGEITIDTCFDADRLDLARFGMTVNPERLATNAAQQFLIGYNGDSDFFIRGFAFELKRLKFNDYNFNVKSTAKIAIRVNVDLGGLVISPFFHISWEMKKKSVELWHKMPDSGIYAFEYPCIREIFNTSELAKKDAEGNGYPFATPLLTLLQYDEDWIIRTQENTVAGYACEIVLSKANIIGMCPITESVQMDAEKIIEDASAKW